MRGHDLPSARGTTFLSSRTLLRLHDPANPGRYCLGAHDTPASRERYNRLISEWYARGQQLPHCATAAGPTVAALALAYLSHADGYYRRPDGTPTSEPESIREALKPLLRLYSRLPASDFSPLKLRAVRESMIEAGWVRTSINRQVNRLRRMFKWGAGHELIPGSVHHTLCSVEGLRAGRSAAAESAPVKPVPEPMIEAVLAVASPVVKAMIELQRLTGMRPAEVCSMRTANIQTAGDVWTYTPATHKTAHHGHSRAIFIGPKAQEILRPWLRADLHAYIFSPADEEKARAAELEKRGADLTPSRRARMERSRRHRRRRPPTDHYTVTTYRRAIQRACDRAFELPTELAAAHKEVRTWVDKWTYKHGRCPRLRELPRGVREKRDAVEAYRSAHRWHPHQLRHNAATELRAKYGIEAARVVLGHRSAGVTEIYAEADLTKAQKIMREVG